jgi:hypothetical protein
MDGETVAQEPISNEQLSIEQLQAFAFNEPLPTPTAEAVTTINEPTNPTVPASVAETPATSEEEIVDDIVYLKQQLGFEDWESAKAALEEYQRLKSTPQTPAEQTFANEQTKKVYQYLKEDKIDDVLKVYDAQRKITKVLSAGVTKENAADIIKLKMELSQNDLVVPLTQEEIEFQYKQEYTYPKEPVQRASEDEDEFNERHDEWKERVSFIEQRKMIAAKMAMSDIDKLKAKIELSDIQPTKVVDQDFEDYKASNAKSIEDYNTIVAPAIKALKESDVSLGFNVNDANNQMQFDIAITPDPQDFEKAKQDALSVLNFLNKTCYDQSGKFLPSKLQRLILLEQNFEKYGYAIAKQAVNAERKRVIEKDTAGNGIRRDYSITPEVKTELDKHAQMAFSV